MSETNLKVGNKVQVKECTECPDIKYLDIGGWKGIITEITKDDQDKDLILIEWDDITLRNMPHYFVEESSELGLINTKMYRRFDEGEVVK
mgnify:CR=1 FL=1